MNKGYYAIIPANVRYDKDIKPNAKLLYGEITALANEKGYCWASNSYFSELYGVNKKTVSSWIGELTLKNYVFSEVIYKDETKEVKERRIYITSPIHQKIDTYPFKSGEGTHQKVDTPIHQKMEDNNTSFNNTTNTTLDKKNNVELLSTDVKKPNKNEFIINEIIKYLNLITGKSYKPTTKAYRKEISGRLKQGATLEQFKHVIDIKTSEWLNNPEMKKNLNPITLFRESNFDRYINQEMPKQKEKTLKDLANQGQIDLSDVL